MSNQLDKPLTSGFTVLKEIPYILRPLADDVIACYRRHHTDLRSIFVIGSVAVGEWTEGISDLDVVGVLEHEFTADDEIGRRSELLTLGDFWPQVSFINNSALSLAALRRKNPDPMVVGRARIIAVTGLYLWGDKLDFQDYMPTVKTMAFERVTRAKILMDRYRFGIINEPFRSNPRLLTRSCAKAALRVLSSMTILRGAVFYTSPQKTVEMVERYVPEALSLAQQALDIVDGTVQNPSLAMRITEQAIELFYSLPNDVS